MTGAASLPAGRASATNELMVVERFISFQGEGPSTGQLAVFVRLGHCNLACTWCDTPYTWNWRAFDPAEQIQRVPIRDLAAWIRRQPPGLVVITGGEPMIQQTALITLVEALQGERQVEIETNGTIAPHAGLVEAVAQFNVSPKLSGAGMPAKRRIVPATLETLAGCGKAVFKFVVTDPVELDEIADLQGRFGLDPVWLMPEGTTAECVLDGLRALADPAIARGWCLSSRLHVLLWGDQRGR